MHGIFRQDFLCSREIAAFAQPLEDAKGSPKRHKAGLVGPAAFFVELDRSIMFRSQPRMSLLQL
jgi:hypothetical protein